MARAGAFAALVALALGACGLDPPLPPQVSLPQLDTALSEVFCEGLDECGCDEEARFASRSECIEWAAATQSEIEGLVEEPKLIYDADCVGSVLSAYVELSCMPGPDLYAPVDAAAIATAEECVAPCAPISGDIRVGRPCRRFDVLSSDCEAGLRCDRGVCRRWCPAVRDEGDACDVTDDCGFVRYCDPNEKRCRSYAQPGERCEDRACAGEALCRLDPTDQGGALRCRTMPELDEPCMGHSECTTGYCPAGFCAVLPRAGESCRGTGICDADSRCVQETCEALPALGEPCDRDCQGDLRCVDSSCREPAATVCAANPPFLRVD